MMIYHYVPIKPIINKNISIAILNAFKDYVHLGKKRGGGGFPICLHVYKYKTFWLNHLLT